MLSVTGSLATYESSDGSFNIHLTTQYKFTDLTELWS